MTISEVALGRSVGRYRRIGGSAGCIMARSARRIIVVVAGGSALVVGWARVVTTERIQVAVLIWVVVLVAVLR